MSDIANEGTVDAGGADANPGGGSTQDDTNLDADKPAEGTPPVETPPEEDEAVVELDGEKFTASQIQEALKIQKNQSDFTSKNQAEAERLNTLARVIEEARQGITNQSVGTPGSGSQSLQDGAGSIQTAEQFRDSLLGDNPQEAIAQLATYIKDTIGKHSNEKDAENAFTTAHPDFRQVVSSPEYKTFVAQNPLGRYLNDVNGYYEFKASTTGKALDDAKTNSFKDGEKTAQAHTRAKSNLKILNSGGGVSIPAKTQITSDTSHGDILNAATAFLSSKRANE